MRKINAILFSAAVVLGAAVSADALAHGGRARVGVYFGAPIGFGYGYAPWYSYPAPYYHPYYYSAPVVAYPPAPTTYVEQSQEAAPAPRADSYWYYCPEAKAYYPYVNQCAGGWQRVSPRPPS
jgi:hypothetical protein